MDIEKSLERLDRWSLTVLSLVCAESMRPVVFHFGSNNALKLFDQGITYGLQSAVNRIIDVNVNQMLLDLDDLVESKCTDSNHPHYEVLRSMHILDNGLSAMTQADPYTFAIAACWAASEQCSGFDMLVEHGLGAVIFDPRNPPSIGPFETLQNELQLVTATTLMNETNMHAVFPTLMGMARDVSRRLDCSLRQIALVRGWTENLNPRAKQ